MTRLVGEDLYPFLRSIEDFDASLQEIVGCSLRSLAAKTVGSTELARALPESRALVVPITAGQGKISGFAETVELILRHLGLEAGRTAQSDVAGLAEALDHGAELIFMADDHRFIALDVALGRYVDNGSATGRGFAQALNEAAGGVAGRQVAVLGLGPVGVAAALHLIELGAEVIAAESSTERKAAVAAVLNGVHFTGTAEALERAELVLDATPEPGIIPDEWAAPGRFVSSPGIPLGVSSRAAAVLGPGLIHEPLAIGVAVMAADLLVSRANLSEGRGKGGASLTET